MLWYRVLSDSLNDQDLDLWSISVFPEGSSWLIRVPLHNDLMFRIKYPEAQILPPQPPSSHHSDVQVRIA